MTQLTLSCGAARNRLPREVVERIPMLLIAKPPLLAEVRDVLRPQYFDEPDEHRLQVLYRAVLDVSERGEQLTYESLAATIDLISADAGAANQLSESERSDLLSDDPEAPGLVEYALHLDPDAVSLDFGRGLVRRFLEERTLVRPLTDLVHGMSGGTFERLPELLAELQARLDRIHTIGGVQNRWWEGGLDTETLLAGDYRTEWIIPGVLAKGQPGQVVGPMKSLKTTFSVDLAVSVATGTPFLGRFEVSQPMRVGVMSGESGQGTIQETVERIARSKRVATVPAAGNGTGRRPSRVLTHCVPRNLTWWFGVPPLDRPEEAIRGLTKMIGDHGLELLIIDPLYLSLGHSGDEGNVFAMGAKFKVLTQIMADTGVTLLLVHHAKKNRPDHFAPLELQDIAWAGSAEWVRQWMLLSRRERYNPDEPGSHRLWLSFGGSAGHSGEYAVDVDEGSLGGGERRRWSVQLMRADEARSETRSRQASAKVEANKAEILAAMRRLGPETMRGIREACGVGKQTFGRAFIAMQEAGEIVGVPVTKNRRQEQGWTVADPVNPASSQEGMAASR